mgnify:CR=1 FL=1
MIYYITQYTAIDDVDLKDITLYGISDDVTYPFIAIIHNENRYQIHYRDSGPERFS